MSDSYLFRYNNGFQINVFGINRKDARQLAIAYAPKWNPVFVGKNLNTLKTVLCATTDKQIERNRINFEKFMNKE